MFCPNCGTKNEDQAMFCLNCGTNLKEVETTTTEPVQEEVAPVQEETVPVQEETAPVQEEATPVQEETAPVQQAAPVQEETAPVQEETAPVQQAAPVQQVPARQPIDKKTKNKIIAICAAVAAIIAVIAVFINVGKAASDYEKLAEKYFKASMDGDWKKVYALVDIPESDLLTEEQFETAMSEQQKIEISSYKVSADKYSDDEVLQRVYVTYLRKGYSGENNLTVKMVKLDGEKTMLFFDKYKVSATNLVSQNYRIRVYKGATVTVDGIAVDSKYTSTDSSDTKYADRYDIYRLPYLFNGTHKIKVTCQNMEDYEETVTVEYDDQSFSMVDATMSSSVLSQLETTAQEDYKKILAAATAKSNFTTIQDLFVNDSTLRDTAKNTYTKFSNGLMDSDGYGYKAINITSSTAKAKQYSGDNDGYVSAYVEVTANYSGEYVTKTYSYTIHGYEDTVKTKTGKTTPTLYYRYQDNQWKIYKISIYSIY